MHYTITDPQDPRLEPYRSVRHRDPQSGFIAEGSLVVGRLLQSDYPVQSLLIHIGQERRYLDQVPVDVPVYLVSPELGQQIAGYDFHRGVLAHGECRAMRSIDELPTSLAPASHDRTTVGNVALGLIGISDPENVGSLLRSAAAMGVHEIVLGPGTISPYVRRVIRVSMASVFLHRFYQLPSPAEQITRLQYQGIDFAATTLRTGAIDIREFHRERDDRPLVLLVGNEATGLDEEVQDRCRFRVTLPMASGTDSLNVGVAGAIFLHELTSAR
ncbi:TrmH family RNA methyltransferase [Neorhodopirellula pilleata]|uniref:Putative TrmH family tRNA/rRNA methyltransferase n=1 Tax=Neorhodopirellula pilleata TaxID=2714738 RepID=A0A5C6AAZ4_9BACT|nr:RNA methyltransferase [Neorhodopirellula pilleata]TWT95503.1 putative TrmH family tRNA/rRNA methyltransferase [Neorhodopirellula pilleata]